ncbi:MAG TPA: TDP-N-acetylfucosamine:lipid II N-acetylfucosaminyltransferase [Sulfurovum sp.]|nr:MAG: hypothetical protein B7Y23_01740 [Sulfurovum sp. 16-42-52]OZA46368.1 MAG: hypothetical protein B7X80_02815 [Sulfurovum sp. 17-42-90]HQS71850.1 TDP-N-acetylfucosamine:lipid II N-acetylfucosaminyltransferase [Sulfurovum sp.]HQT27850.1 TDP-N-acetylfucosamine:lipid II N-acetylfucosaminyltransferase [Sulfurovum sp.]
MILHIMPDSVFTDFVIDKLDKLDAGNHEFIINSIHNELKFTKNRNIQIYNTKKLLSKDFIASLASYSAVVFHSLSSIPLKRLVMKVSLDVKFVWLGWGGDYYETIPQLKRTLYEQQTLKLMSSLTSLKEKVKKAIKALIPNYDIEVEEIYKRVNYFGPVLYDEYKLLEEIFAPVHTKYIPFSYGQLENDLTQGIEYLEINGENILLGNSATFSNNHLEIIELLKNLDLGDRKVIVPLNYGNKEYAREIISFGNNKIKNNFYPLSEFMDKEKYHKLLSGCSICIMNHKRQQSLGNIVSVLYLGSKLFLNKENIVYRFLKREGAVIFSIEDLNTKSISVKLTKNEIELNRSILMKHWSEEVVNEKYRSFVNLLK